MRTRIRTVKVEVRRSVFSQESYHWYWRIIALNGQVLATSEMYYSHSNALRAAKNFVDDTDVSCFEVVDTREQERISQ